MRYERGSPYMVVLLILLGLSSVPFTAENIDPDNDGSQYAWAENIGWLNAEPLGDGGSGLEVTDTEITGWMWAENAGWVSFSCKNTGSCGTVSYGVTNDGCGHLAGKAWAENVGWISLSHTQGGVAIDPTNGEFTGEAWAENVGWIRFASQGSVDYRVKTSWTRLPPSGTCSLTLSQEESDTTLSWTALAGATAYDVVEGDLGVLRVSGDFATATTGCTAEDHDATSATHSTSPGAGDGYWFLVRGVNCGGAGTYDSGGAGQGQSRDAGVNGSAAACQ